jgi:hypothetical protein
MAQSSSARTSRKAHTRPEKPYPEFPLYPHPFGYRSKRVDGKLLHFGRWGRVVKGVVIREAIEKRPKPATFADVELVFLTYRGTAWVRMGEKSRSDYLSIHFNALAKRLKVQRPGLSFYSLRHVFRTIADAARDIPAVRAIMGHVDAGIDAVYREWIDDARLRAVVDHVHAWLFPKLDPTTEPKSEGAEVKETGVANR